MPKKTKKQLAIPEWLTIQNEISDDRKKELLDHCSNWVRFSPLMRDITDDECRFVVLNEFQRNPPRAEFVLRPSKKLLRNDLNNKIKDLMKVYDARIFG